MHDQLVFLARQPARLEGMQLENVHGGGDELSAAVVLLDLALVCLEISLHSVRFVHLTDEAERIRFLHRKLKLVFDQVLADDVIIVRSVPVLEHLRLLLLLLFLLRSLNLVHSYRWFLLLELQLRIELIFKALAVD